MLWFSARDGVMRFELVISQLIMRSWVEVEGDLKGGGGNHFDVLVAWVCKLGDNSGRKGAFIFSGKN